MELSVSSTQEEHCNRKWENENVKHYYPKLMIFFCLLFILTFVQFGNQSTYCFLLSFDYHFDSAQNEWLSWACYKSDWYLFSTLHTLLYFDYNRFLLYLCEKSSLKSIPFLHTSILVFIFLQGIEKVSKMQLTWLLICM